MNSIFNYRGYIVEGSKIHVCGYVKDNTRILIQDNNEGINKMKGYKLFNNKEKGLYFNCKGNKYYLSEFTPVKRGEAV